MSKTLKLAVLSMGVWLAMPGMAQTPAEKPASGLDKVGESAERMAVKPLKDLNLMKDEIPPEIQKIIDRPYDISTLKTCAQKKAAVGRLTAVLGPDVDSAQATKKGENPAEFALSVGESAVGGLIPGMGIIRKISGADAAQKKAQAAVLAGQLRRAYIKGAARATGCKI